jgi:LysM repeat protein
MGRFRLRNWLIERQQTKSAGQSALQRTYSHTRSGRLLLGLISVLVAGGALMPADAKAGVIGDVLAFFTKSANAEVTDGSTEFGNVQTMPLPKPAMNINPSPARGGGEVTIVDASAVMPAEGPSGTIADIEKPKNDTISTYVVREGDTLSGIAKMFDVTVNTILWANDLPTGAKIKAGQQLTILPITGIKHVVKKGDTLSTLAKKYGADESEIASFNAVDSALALVTGEEIIIPDGEPTAPPKPVVVKAKVGGGSTRPVARSGSSVENGYFAAPLASYTETQGIHGYNAVDLAAPVGTSVLASAAGTVIVAKASGWNGGYGTYAVIQHDNGSQTLYSHMSKLYAVDGQRVTQGQAIGTVGQTGKATGPHLHFEIRNGIRNPF